MFDLQIGVVTSPVSYIKYNWEAEHFQRLRFNILWEGQSRLSKILLILVDAMATAYLGRVYGFTAAIIFNIAWSVPLTILYEKKRGLHDDDIFTTPKVRSRWSPVNWGLYLLKVLAFAGFKDVIITRVMISLRWVARQLPQPTKRVETAIILVGLSLTGVRASHQILKEAGFAHATILSWNSWGRFLNASFQVLEAVYLRWFWTTLWAWSLTIVSLASIN